jgi:hypothetical protein
MVSIMLKMNISPNVSVLVYIIRESIINYSDLVRFWVEAIPKLPAATWKEPAQIPAPATSPAK